MIMTGIFILRSFIQNLVGIYVGFFEWIGWFWMPCRVTNMTLIWNKAYLKYLSHFK